MAGRRIQPSEIYVPQVHGTLPAGSAKSDMTVKSQPLVRDGANVAPRLPPDCGPDNAQSEECQKIIQQRSQSLGR